ncbi:MAG TPA: hypothetical protein VMS01_04275 [Stellaceae bacterium]|nr:hypothetical protein [Stellaceae bacterium]
MATPFRLWENAQIVNLLPAAADAAGRISSYVSVKYGHKAFLVCGVNQGNAATVTFTPLQATDNLGTNSAGLSAGAPIAADLDTSTSTGSDQFTFPAAAASYTTDAGLKNKIVVFEIDPVEQMNPNNLASGNPLPFSHIAIQTGASNAANITSAYLVVMPLRDQRLNPPTTYV